MIPLEYFLDGQRSLVRSLFHSPSVLVLRPFSSALNVLLLRVLDNLHQGLAVRVVVRFELGSLL